MSIADDVKPSRILDARPTAKFLADEMKKHKGVDIIALDDGSTTNARDYFAPLMLKYNHIFNEIELRATVFAGLSQSQNIKLETRWLHNRMRHIRMMLAQVTYKSSDYACVTLNIKGFNFAYIYVLMVDDPAIAYVSIGDSMKSYDGEWRDLMTTIDGLNYALQEYSQEIDAIVKQIRFPHTPKMDVYFSAKLKQAVVTKIRNRIFQDDLDKKLAALAWFVARRKHTVTPAFKKFATALGRGQPKNDLRHDELFLIMGSIYDTRPSQRLAPLESRISSIGQKLTQLTPDETSHPLNSGYQAWNEVIATQLTLDLILNMICPGFSVHSFWIMLYGTSQYIFNSQEMQARIAQSQTIRLTPRDKRTSKILTDVAICAVNEYCGRTWRASLDDETTRPNVLKHGSRLVFEYIYALYCFHSRLGQFHGDFHCENATVLRTFRDESPTPSSDLDLDSVYIGYIIGDAAYCFQSMATSGYVIDFSRSINMDNPMWIERVIDKYHLYFGWPKPDNIAAFDENVYGALDNSAKLARLKKIASAFDPWEFANTTLIQCSDAVSGTSLEKLLLGIRERAASILATVLESENPGANIQWATYTILTEFWESRPAAEISAVGTFGAIYRFDNEMKYSAKSLKTLPRSISAGPIVRDEDDEPIDMYVFPANLIRARYKMMDENMQEMIGRSIISDGESDKKV